MMNYALKNLKIKIKELKKQKTGTKKKYHCSLNIIIKDFYRRGFAYKGNFKNCKSIIEFCPNCNQKKTNYYKREPRQQLIFNKPLERVIADLTELPYELIYNAGYKYQLNLIDHFSKFTFSYKLKD